MYVCIYVLKYGCKKPAHNWVVHFNFFWFIKKVISIILHVIYYFKEFSRNNKINKKVQINNGINLINKWINQFP